MYEQDQADNNYGPRERKPYYKRAFLYLQGGNPLAFVIYWYKTMVKSLWENRRRGTMREQAKRRNIHEALLGERAGVT